MTGLIFSQPNSKAETASSTTFSTPIWSASSATSEEPLRPLRGLVKRSTHSSLPTPLACAAEAIADDLLRRARTRVGESLRVAAKRLGVDVEEHQLDPGVHGAAIIRFRSIVLSPSGYTARDEFTLAHELMELHIPGSWRRDLPKATKEAACDRGAAALLLPAAAFKQSVAELGANLPPLRRRWAHASWSTIARRMVDVGAATSAASWDCLEQTWRYGPGETTREEEDALVLACFNGRGSASAKGIRAWRLGGEGPGRAVSISRGNSASASLSAPRGYA